MRSCGSVRVKSSSSSSLGGGLKYWPIAPTARLYSSWSVQARTSNMAATLQIPEWQMR